MKRLLVVVLLVSGGLAVESYLLTGRWPWVALSPEEEQVAVLRETLGRIRQQWREAGKTQAPGVDASSLSDDIPGRLARQDQEVEALLPQLRTTEAREQAVLLRREIATARTEMR